VCEVKAVRSFTPTLRTNITDIAVLLTVFLATLAVASSPAPTTIARANPFLDTGTIATPVLSILGETSTLNVGNSTLLEAVWSSAGTGCGAVPLDYQWGTAVGSASGVLEPSVGPKVDFTPLADASGPAVVTVRSTALVECAKFDRVLTEDAVRSLTAVSPLEVEDVGVEPNPVAPEVSTNLSLIVADGAPPYHLGVTWGDGNSTELTLTSPGSVEIAHRFEPGRYSPTIDLSDGAGATVRTSVPEPVNVSGGLAAAIRLGEPALEAGIAEKVSAIVIGPVLRTLNWTQCSEAWGSSEREVASFTSNVTCEFPFPGTGTIAYLASYHNSTGAGVVVTTLSAPVLPSLSIAIGAEPSAVEIGSPTSLVVDVRGGAPPFRLAWSGASNSSVANVAAYTDGPVAIPVVPTASGPYDLRVWATDADGATANATEVLSVVPSPSATITTSLSAGTSGATASLEANVTGGCAPYSWWVVSAPIGGNGSVADGILPTAGAFGWNETLRAEGALPLWVVVFDSDGATWSWDQDLPLIPTLGASVWARAASNTSAEWLVVDAALRGGVPPFNLTASFGTTLNWSVLVPADGSVTFNVSTNLTGSTRVLFRVEDAWGNNWTTSEVLTFPASSNSSAPTPPPLIPPGGPEHGTSGVSWAVGTGVVLGLIAVVVVLRWRSKRSRTAPPPPDPVEVVRSIVEPAEGADRATVELLAEDGGVPYAEARTTIDRLIANGTLRSETGPDGVEILAWSEPG
jgi:hypothetical protein